MSDPDDPIASLRRAAERRSEKREQVDDIGLETLRTVADAYRDVETLLDRYEERITDRDDLEGYIEFRERLTEVLEALDADIRHSEAFVDANDALTTGVTSTLSTSDVDRARAALDPVRNDASLLDAWQSARDDYRSARHEAERHEAELRDRVEELERVRELGAADLDAPTQDIRVPIESYNDAVTDAFNRFLRDASARDVLEFLETATAYPLVELPAPPAPLRDYLHTASVGTEPVSVLVEYAEYSRSKLDHYVSDPQSFQAAVGPHTRLLATLSADPLTVEWPPKPASELRWRMRELVAAVGRFADEETVALARAVRALTERDDYDRLRDAAVAREVLTDEQRARLKRGAVEEELEAKRAAAEDVAACLDEHPPLDE
ncbi:DUF7118 family protein [Haloferax elongans]|uniref:DUF7118 family protein n=1 Tax=Haloferax elongans TaxID=403191 RepID=UPI000677B036|nr:hypothetical protein [Haloferax elongans]